jgi:SAM-dependent methyltransferase
MTSPAADPWLSPWLPLLREHAADQPVLELGCGSGHDTATLLAAGLSVVAMDLSTEAVRQARDRAPGARFHVQDLRDPWPADATNLGGAVASLSLHYFPWHVTQQLVARIHHTLRPGGMLLCRLNSTDDHHFGASGHPAIEPHYYLVDGQPKHFFDRADIDHLFSSGWRTLSVRSPTIHRYAQPKQIWEIVLESET